MYLVEFTFEIIWSWLLSAGSFWIMYLISLLVISLFKLSLLESVLAGCMFLEICTFLLGCPICWYTIVHSFMIVLYLCGVSCYFSSFITYFVYSGTPFFLLGEPGQRTCLRTSVLPTPGHVSFIRFGKFSTIIYSNTFLISFSLSFSGISIMCMVHFKPH